MRTATTLALLLVPLSGRAATISIGGDLHLDGYPFLIAHAGHGETFDQWFVEQPAGNDRVERTVDLGAVAWIQVENRGQPLPKLWLVGMFPDESPNPYVGAMTLELIAGPLVGPPDAPTAQEWTFIVDGGAPEVRSVAFVPEPGAWALIIPSLLYILGRARSAGGR